MVDNPINNRFDDNFQSITTKAKPVCMKILMFLVALVPSLSFAQTVKVNEYDKFTKQRRIELQPIRIYSSGNGNVNLAFTSFGSMLNVQLKGVGWGASAIDEGQKLVFLFSNDSTVAVTSAAVQTAEVNDAYQLAYSHNYFARMSDIRLLSEYNVVGIRKYGLGDHADIKVSRDNSQKIKALSKLFLSELKSANIMGTIQEIDIRDVAKHIGDSVRFCTKVYNTRYFETVVNRPTILDVNNSYVSQLNVIIWEQDRKNFQTAPELLYNQKDVCISGVVQASNNMPQIIIRNRDQITMKSPVTLPEVNKFAGDSITVSGKVVTAKILTNTAEAPTLLNIGAAYPYQELTVVINSKDRGKFNGTPETYYLNKEISVSGKVEMVAGKPQMLVQDKNQIRELPPSLVKNPDTANKSSQANQTEPVRPQTTAATSTNKSNERSASFPGGQDALLAYLKGNLVCPENELGVGEKKVVVVKFLIQPDGSASNIQITKPAGSSFDREVIRVLRMMPKWEPHLTNGTPVSVSVTQPITFARGGN